MAKEGLQSSRTSTQLKTYQKANIKVLVLLTCGTSYKRNKTSISEEIHGHQRILDASISFPEPKKYKTSAANGDRADDRCTVPRVYTSSLKESAFVHSVGNVYMYPGDTHEE